MRVAVFAFFLLLGTSALAPAVAETPIARHAIAMHGEPKYGPDFQHVDYANPTAPKGGGIKLAAAGTFDSLNPFIIKGVPAPGVGMIYQTLMESSQDEAFTEYGLIAKSIEIPEDRSFVIFNLRPEAKWHDGKPITAADVIWSFETLVKYGRPHYRSYYANVKKVVAENDHRVRFVFDRPGNRELPLIMGQLPVLPKHFWKDKDFNSTSLDVVPLGSGPYKVRNFRSGQSIVYERVANWWAQDLPINKGRYNFDTIAYETYRDETVLIQALMAGRYDLRLENIAKAWATEYNHPAVRRGWIVKKEIPHEIPTGMQGYVFNTRRPVFADPAVRRALAFAFDFEWSNRQFAYDAYKRTTSFFSNSELASSGLPQGKEKELLEAYRDQLPESVFEEPYRLPVNDGSGRDMRRNLSTAAQILREAGWTPGQDGILQKEGQRLSFEFIFDMPSFQRWTGPFIANLKRLGVDATMRVLDTAQYRNRLDRFDFDVTVSTFPQSLSPGNEQRNYWGSESADQQGSRNLMGVRDPVVDGLIEKIVSADTREELISASRALDRVLLHGHYVVPQWHISAFRVAYWNKFDMPDIAPKYSFNFDSWWFDQNKAAQIDQGLAGQKKD